MDEESEDLDKYEAGFFRQRRNLLIATCLLWFMAFGEVRQPPQSATLSGFGVSIAIENPRALFVGLWLVFLYFFLRYCIYALAQQFNLTRRFSDHVGRSTNPLIYAAVAKELGWRTFSFGDGFPSAWQLWRGERTFEVQGGGVKELVNVSATKWKLARTMGASTARFLLLDPAISDYVLPFLLALAVAWYAGVADWGGRIANLL